MIPEFTVAYGYNTIMKLNNKQIKFLRGLSHSKKPVVTVGNNGLSSSVLEEIDNALSRHELIKVKLPAGEKTAKQVLVETICLQSGATAIALTGRTAVIFRQTVETSGSSPSKIDINV